MSKRVLVLIKPDGMHKNLVGNVINKFTASDLRLVGLKIVKVSQSRAEAHYALLAKQPFFAGIVNYLTGKYHGGQPVVAMVLDGHGAVAKCRAIAGATNPEEAHPKSVRGAWGRITTKGLWENLVHVSSDDKEAQREIKLWFKKGELL